MLGAMEAINQLWPDAIPKGLSAKDRNNLIVHQIERNGGSVPTAPARLIQRALKKLKKQKSK
jgi:hypothetical protein